jgi:endonuclease YncB( thermonuclease family)
MSAVRVCVLLSALIVPFVPLATSAAEQPAAAPACRTETIGSAIVATVIDGRTIRLVDGREVRLAGIEVPAPGGGPPAEAAKTALAGLVEGKEVLLRRPVRTTDRATDRHGRMVAHVFLVTDVFVASAFARRDETEHSVQEALLAAGAARIGARSAEAFCPAEPPAKWAEKFIAAERSARSGKLGLWRISGYEVMRAEDPAGVLGELGRFTLVEGKVVSVRESGGTIYVNFGRRWSEDFTVTIAKRNERIFAAAGIEPGKLTGRRITVRGYVEARGGPWIEAAVPEQIEVGRDK